MSIDFGDITAWSELAEIERAHYFGTSHTAVLFDAHPFETAADYWLDKVQGRDKPETQPMIRGRYLEPAIADWFASTWLDERVPIVRAKPFTRGPFVSIPDYILPDYDGLLSIKTTTRVPDAVEPYWWYQLQGEMLTCGFERGVVAWMDGRQELHVEEVEYDYDVGVELWLRATEFMSSVMQGVMSERISDSHTADSIIRQFPNPTGVMSVDDDVAEMVNEYRRLKDEEANYKAAASHLRSELFKIVQDQEAMEHDGEVIATFKAQKGRSSIDTKALSQDHPDLVKEYVRQSEPTRALRTPKARS